MDTRLPRGAFPTPQHEIDAALSYVPPQLDIPTSYLMWPYQMSYWGNDKHGDCVAAEEAFAKAAATQYFITEETVIAWSTANNVLEGAYLPDVMRKMASHGFPATTATFGDGPYSSVNWVNDTVLQSAVYLNGPVKLGVAAENFQSNPKGKVTGGSSGWAMYDYPAHLALDHCVGLCGYGTLDELVKLFKAHGENVSIPKGMPTGLCYAFFTWKSIGIVDVQSLRNMTGEAWVRDPVTTVALTQYRVGDSNTTSATPVVTSDGWVWFRGSNHGLYKVFYDGTQQSKPGDNSTSSSPFITSDGWVWFQGTNDHLYKMYHDGSQKTQPGDNKTSSTPFVTSDGWVWFQGTNNDLYKMFLDGTQKSQPGNNKTLSSPLVVGNVVYFRGTDDKLWKMNTDGTNLVNINSDKTSSTPFVTSDGWVWFRGDNNGLYKVFNDGTKQSRLGNTQIFSSPVVVGDYVYFQGVDDSLRRMKTDGTQENVVNLNNALSAPFVTTDGWIYFRGKDDKLFRCLASA